MQPQFWGKRDIRQTHAFMSTHLGLHGDLGALGRNLDAIAQVARLVVNLDALVEELLLQT